MQLTHGPARSAAEGVSGTFDVPTGLWGFGGLHGGLAVALLARAMSGNGDVQQLRDITAVFHRGVRGRVDIAADAVRPGPGIVTATGRISGERGDLVTATAIFGSAGPADATSAVFAPAIPSGAGSPLDWDQFVVPPEFVPFAVHTEIRPVGAALPFSGAAEPELTAWIRLVEDDDPPDVLRFLILVDAVAPSYAAVLTTPEPIPTIELSARPSDALGGAASPWVLVRARTTGTFGGGWLDEQIDVWGTDGTHLGSARQLRLARGSAG